MELVASQKYPVKVLRIIKAGLIVEMEDKSTELIHISKIANAYVSNAADFVTVGETYEAEAIQGTARPVELSLKHLNLKSTAPQAGPSRNSVERDFGKLPRKNDSFESMLAKSKADLSDKLASNPDQARRNAPRRRK